MTREQAIWLIQDHMDVHKIGVYPHIKLAEALDMAISALRQQEHFRDVTKKVEPLTLDELREMDGEPVWVVWPDGRIKSKWWIVNSGCWMDMFWDDNGNISIDYGTVWVAYRQKPEGEA